MVALFLPGVVFILGAGFVFGFWRGLLAVWIGGAVGQALAFLLARCAVHAACVQGSSVCSAAPATDCGMLACVLWRRHAARPRAPACITCVCMMCAGRRAAPPAYAALAPHLGRCRYLLYDWVESTVKRQVRGASALMHQAHSARGSSIPGAPPNTNSIKLTHLCVPVRACCAARAVGQVGDTGPSD